MFSLGCLILNLYFGDAIFNKIAGNKSQAAEKLLLLAEESDLDADLIDILFGMLHSSRTRRMTAQEALTRPFFKELYSKKLTVKKFTSASTVENTGSEPCESPQSENYEPALIKKIVI